MIRILGALIALGVIAAFTYLNVMHSGGFGAPDAPLIIAVAAMMAVGSTLCGWAWRHSGKLGAIVLGLCLIVGECYWIATNADRDFTARSAALQPENDARLRRADLQRRLEDARANRDGARKALTDQAPLPGCRKECASLLRANVAAALQSYTDAQAALDALPPARDAKTLAEQFNIAEWQWDALLSLARGLMAMGASVALGLVLHPKKRTQELTPKPLAPKKLEVVQTPQRLMPPPKRSPPRADATKVLVDFGSERIKRDATGKVHMRDVLLAYEDFCAQNLEMPLDRTLFVRKFADLCEHAGLTVELQGRDAYIVGAKLVA